MSTEDNTLNPQTPLVDTEKEEEIPQRKRDLPHQPPTVSVGGLGPLATLAKYQNYILAVVVLAAAAGGYWYYKNKMCGPKTESSGNGNVSNGSKASKASRASQGSKASRTSHASKSVSHGSKI